jgi:hypothetical protein
VPKESQFPDGRYAHLWKTYEPKDVLEARGKTDQEKLQDIYDAYKGRQQHIGDLAQENCSFEYMEQWECFRHPGFKQLATLCRAESKKFNRCVEVQSKIMKALGMMAMEPRTQSEMDAMQIHADNMYRKMLEQEKLIEEAKERGEEPPVFESVISKATSAKNPAAPQTSTTPLLDQSTAAAGATDDVWNQIKPERREEYEKELAKLPKEQQELERKVLEAELRAKLGMSSTVETIFIEESIARNKRREAGQSTFGDFLKHMWGWK